MPDLEETSLSKERYDKLTIQSQIKGSLLGQNLEFLQKVDSTNTELKNKARNNALEGHVLIAETQTSGRGRRGKEWVSKPNMGIWMSVLLRPRIDPKLVQTITLAASVAVVRALEKHGVSGLGIKWPNDILINGMKVCGILTELSAQEGNVEWVVLGIGLNVNHLKRDFPDHLKSTATSIRLSSGKSASINRSSIASDIINELEDIYINFIHKGPSWVVEEWKKYNITLGKRVSLITTSEEYQVYVLDITADGQLIVKYDDGTLGQVLSGEISLRETNN